MATVTTEMKTDAYTESAEASAILGRILAHSTFSVKLFRFSLTQTSIRLTLVFRTEVLPLHGGGKHRRIRQERHEILLKLRVILQQFLPRAFQLVGLAQAVFADAAEHLGERGRQRSGWVAMNR